MRWHSQPSFPRSTLLDGPRESWGAKQIIDAAKAGDPHGLKTWDHYLRDLAIGIANVIAFVNPREDRAGRRRFGHRRVSAGRAPAAGGCADDDGA